MTDRDKGEPNSPSQINSLIADISGLNTGDIRVNFLESLRTKIELIRQSVSTTAKELSIIEGGKFTSLKPTAKRERMYDLADSEKDSPISYLERYLDDLRCEYYKTPHVGSSHAWNKFRVAFRNFYAKIEDGEIHAVFTPPARDFRLEIFCFEPLSLNKSTVTDNFQITHVQTDIARAIGILKPDQEWVDFMTNSGTPTVFEHIPTKYPDLSAGITFDTSGSTDEYSKPLAQLMAEGLAIPRIFINVKTEMLLTWKDPVHR